MGRSHPERSRGGEAIVDWCSDQNLGIGNTTQPTRRGQPPKGHPSSPDLTLSKECTLSNWTPIATGDSDHYHIFFHIQFGSDDLPTATTSRPPRALYSWKNADWALFSRTLRLDADAFHTRWPLSYQVTWATSRIHQAQLKAVPRGGARKSPPWSLDIVKLDQVIQSQSKLLETAPVAERTAIYATLTDAVAERRRLLTALVEQSWQERCTDMWTGDSSTWKTLSAIYAPRSLRSPAVKIGDKVLSSKARARALLRLFVQKSTRHPDAAPAPPVHPTGSVAPISWIEYRSALAELSLGSAAGPDGIYNEALRRLPIQFARILLHIFNRSLRTGHVPSA